MKRFTFYKRKCSETRLSYHFMNSVSNLSLFCFILLTHEGGFPTQLDKPDLRYKEIMRKVSPIE